MLKSIKILIISERQERLSDFAHALQEDRDVELLAATKVEDAINMAEYHAPALIVVDEQVGDRSGLDLVRRLIEVNAFVNAAVFSSLTEEEFHRRSEGLGILARLPIQPGNKDALKLLDLLRPLMPTIRPK